MWKGVRHTVYTAFVGLLEHCQKYIHAALRAELLPLETLHNPQLLIICSHSASSIFYLLSVEWVQVQKQGQVFIRCIKELIFSCRKNRLYSNTILLLTRCLCHNTLGWLGEITQRRNYDSSAVTLNKKRRNGEETLCSSCAGHIDNGAHRFRPKCIFSSIICITCYIIKPRAVP